MRGARGVFVVCEKCKMFFFDVKAGVWFKGRASSSPFCLKRLLSRAARIIIIIELYI